MELRLASSRAPVRIQARLVLWWMLVVNVLLVLVHIWFVWEMYWIVAQMAADMGEPGTGSAVGSFPRFFYWATVQDPMGTAAQLLLLGTALLAGVWLVVLRRASNSRRVEQRTGWICLIGLVAMALAILSHAAPAIT